MKNNLKGTLKIALSAATYVVLTLVTSFFNIAGVSIRISEFLLFLVLIDYRYIYGISVGTCIANLILSNLGPIDALIGTLATVISLLLMIFIKNKKISYIWPSIVNGLIVGTETAIIYKLPIHLSILATSIIELLTLLIGYQFYKLLIKNNKAVELIKIVNNDIENK